MRYRNAWLHIRWRWENGVAALPGALPFPPHSGMSPVRVSPCYGAFEADARGCLWGQRPAQARLPAEGRGVRVALVCFVATDARYTPAVWAELEAQERASLQLSTVDRILSDTIDLGIGRPHGPSSRCSAAGPCEMRLCPTFSPP